VDDAAGQSAASAQHMNDSMSDIRERNLEISEYSESTQVGVSALQRSMREVADNLSEFKIEQQSRRNNDAAPTTDIEEVTSIAEAKRIYQEDEMSALENEDKAEEAASV
jgi:hypothetical protein